MRHSTTEASLPSRRRRFTLPLPTDPSEEELIRDWTLSDSDLDEIRRCRRAGNRRRFALQLCILRLYGQFVSDFSMVPVRIANYLSHQLDLAPVLFVELPVREAMDLTHEQRIREYLGFQSFTLEVRQRLERELAERAGTGQLPTELLAQAEALLHNWKVVLPGPARLERIIGTVFTHAQDEAFQRIRERLSRRFCDKIDELLRVPANDDRSSLFRLKEYPPEPTPAAILSYIERFRLVQALGTSDLNLTDLSPAQVESLAQLARRYDVDDLKQFSPPKRYALIACFLSETQKTLLDHLVAMHHSS